MNVIPARNLGLRYGKRWALRGCNLEIAAGRVVGLVGPNGAGKTTLLHLLTGLLEPSEGEVLIHGDAPRPGGAGVRVGFVAQDAPLYRSFSVADMLRFGAELNDGWDDNLARARLDAADMRLDDRVGELSGGQRAHVALALALAKHPEVVLLDEPLASLDPYARRAFLAQLMEVAATERPTIVLSSHLLSDLERVCDALVVVARGRVAVAGDVEDLLASHRIAVGPSDADVAALAGVDGVVCERRAGRQLTATVRMSASFPDPRWELIEPTLEELVLAYLDPDAIADARHALSEASR